MTKTLLSFSFAAAAFVLAGCGPSSPAEQQTVEGSMPGSSVRFHAMSSQGFLRSVGLKIPKTSP